jgi:hypothetical protein
MAIIRIATIVLVLLTAPYAQATLIDYSLTVSGPFFGNGPNGIPISGEPFGLPLPQDMASLSGTMTLDSTKGVNDPSALVDFQMTTGTRTWTEADLDPNTTFFALFQSDILQSFGMDFRDSPLAIMGISSVNSWYVVQAPYIGANYDNARSCNGCVSFAVRTVPEPSTIYLLLSALCAAGVASLMPMKAINSLMLHKHPQSP